MNAGPVTEASVPKTGEGFWRRGWQRVRGQILDQLRQGVSPEKVAFTLALGAMLGIFPIFGSSSLLCVGAGLALRLNQPLLQAVNYLMTPLQLICIVIFVRLGEWIYHAPAMPIIPAELIASFREDPMAFLARFGWSGIHGVTAWLLISLPVLWILSAALKRCFRNPGRGEGQVS